MKAEIYIGLDEVNQSRVRNLKSNDKVMTIISVVAEHFGLEVKDLLDNRRYRKLVDARHIAQYLCVRHTTSSLSNIGSFFTSVANKHCPVIHARKKCEILISSDAEFRKQFYAVQEKVKYTLELM